MKTTPINWVKEQEAMQMLGYSKSSLRIFTMNEKRKKLPIRTKKLNHKTVLYSKMDIEQFINQ
jgi:predicted DNA-binding transcriptional regulator AlpA